MKYNDSYIAILTVVEELVERVNNVFAERLKLETPFVSASTAYIRGFFTFKGYSFKKSFLYRLRVDKRIVNKKQALLAPATCYHDKWLKQRIMARLHHVSSLVSFRRLIVERGNIMYLNALHGR